jgi:hypothetical protein
MIPAWMELIFWIMVQSTIILLATLLGYSKGWKEGTRHGFQRGLIRGNR